MNDTDTSHMIGSLEDLEKTARQAADQLSQASSHNAIWDKAAKAIKPGLADLSKVREEAGQEAKQAYDLIKSLEDGYDSDVSGSVRKTREAVDAEIESLRRKTSGKWDELNRAKEKAASAKKAVEESTANFDMAQKELIGFSKTIQDQQKQVAALEKEVKDADARHQLVETIVKLEDLKKELSKLTEWIKPEYEAEKWSALNTAADDLIRKTDALPGALARVPAAEEEYKTAKTEYENAVKNRLDTIKQRLADEKGAAVEEPTAS